MSKEILVDDNNIETKLLSKKRKASCKINQDIIGLLNSDYMEKGTQKTHNDKKLNNQRKFENPESKKSIVKEIKDQTVFNLNVKENKSDIFKSSKYILIL